MSRFELLLLSGAHTPLYAAQVSDSLKNESDANACLTQAVVRSVSQKREESLSEVVSESRIWRGR
jgi:predicted transcriptional regulator